MSDIENILPHRSPMLLVDRMVAASGEEAVAEYTPVGGQWYSDGAGNMPGWIGIELMAQTVAAHVGWLKMREGASPKPGALLGTRSYVSNTGAYTCGETLSITARRIYMDESGIGAYECAITSSGEPLAHATLKVYEPEDFSRFVQGESRGDDA